MADLPVLRWFAGPLLAFALSANLAAAASLTDTQPPVPLPTLLDRERLAALDHTIPAQFTIDGGKVPLLLTIGGEGQADLYWAGSSKRAAITLTNRGGDAVRDIVLLLRPSHATIKAIHSQTLRWRETEHGWIAALRAIEPGETIDFVVQLVLAHAARPAAKPADQATLNELRAIVKPREAAQPLEAALNWNVDDCAARFETRLASLRDDPRRNPKLALAAALAREPDLPRRFLFAQGSKGLSKEQQAALRFANGVRSTGGVTSSLKSEEYKWLTGRLARDIANYLKQEPTPAICAPAGPMLDYLQRRAAPLQGKIDSARRHRQVWAGYARSQAANALRQLSEQQVATTDPLTLPAAIAINDATPWADVVAALAQAAGADNTQMVRLKNADTAFAALSLSKDMLDNDPAFAPRTVLKPRRQGSRRMVKVKEENPRAAVLRRAYGAIERAVYLNLSATRYDGLEAAFTGNIVEIGRANAQSCTCGY